MVSVHCTLYMYVTGLSPTYIHVPEATDIFVRKYMYGVHVHVHEERLGNIFREL